MNGEWRFCFELTTTGWNVCQAEKDALFDFLDEFTHSPAQNLYSHRFLSSLVIDNLEGQRREQIQEYAFFNS
jgi:hypothetical protein